MKIPQLAALLPALVDGARSVTINVWIEILALLVLQHRPTCGTRGLISQDVRTGRWRNDKSSIGHI